MSVRPYRRGPSPVNRFLAIVFRIVARAPVGERPTVGAFIFGLLADRTGYANAMAAGWAVVVLSVAAVVVALGPEKRACCAARGSIETTADPTANADRAIAPASPGADRMGRRREFRTADATSLHYGTVTNCAFPGRLSEPGPGRSASPSSARLPVGGMQKLLTSTPGCGRPSVRSPAGEPFCVITTAVTPGSRCPGLGPPSCRMLLRAPAPGRTVRPASRP